MPHCTFADPARTWSSGLADDHLWAGGGGVCGNGIFCNANIPTEECFTTPHKDALNGHRHRIEAAVAPGHADRKHFGTF